MNCTDFQNEMSRYLDGDLEPQRAVEAGIHLGDCEPCARSFEEFSLMLDSCRGIEIDEEVPPNAEALWCRISNVIETESVAEKRIEQKAEPVRRWNFSFGQAFAAFAGIALVSSLLTVVAVRNYLEPAAEDMVTRSAETETTFERFLSRVRPARHANAAFASSRPRSIIGTSVSEPAVPNGTSGCSRRLTAIFARSIRP